MTGARRNLVVTMQYKVVMDWIDLQHFIAAAEELSFSRAATRLHVSHPAVSQRISRLERVLDARLFERRSTGVRLTASGKALLPRAQELLALRDQARLAVTGLVDETSAPPLKFGTVELRSHRLIPFVEQTFGRPLDWITDSTPVLCEAIGEGRLSGALCAQFPGEPLRVPPGCSVTSVAHDRIAVMMPPSEAGDRQHVSFDELRGRTWIVSPPSQHPHEWEVALLQPFEATCVATLPHPGEQLIAAGEAVALASGLCRDTDELKIVPLMPPIHRHLYLLWNDELPYGPARRLAEVLRDYYFSQLAAVAEEAS